MNRMLFFLAFLLFSNHSLFSQENGNQRMNELLEIVQSTPSRYEKDIQSLANYLSSKTDNEGETVSIFFLWLTENISYDYADYKRTKIGTFRTVESVESDRKRIVKNTLSRKLAVCQGYAFTFHKLCEAAGIQSVVAKGMARHDANDQQAIGQRPRHAWNLVKIYNQWWHIDATWGAGHIRDERFYSERNWTYFMPKANDFIRTHYPIDPIFQLLETPVPFAIFEQGEAAISSFLTEEKTDKIAFADSLSIQAKLPIEKKALYSAQRSHRFNPQDPERYAHALNNYSTFITRRAIDLHKQRMPLDTILSITAEASTYARLATQTSPNQNFKNSLAISLLNQATFISNKANQLAQNTNTTNEAIRILLESLPLIEEAMPFHESKKKVLEQKGYTLSTLGYAYLQQAMFDNQRIESGKTAIDYFNKAEKALKASGTQAAKLALQNTRNNRSVLQQNLKIWTR